MKYLLLLGLFCSAIQADEYTCQQTLNLCDNYTKTQEAYIAQLKDDKKALEGALTKSDGSFLGIPPLGWLLIGIGTGVATTAIIRR